MNLKVTTAPTVKGVYLADMKNYLRVTHDEDDGLLQSMIDAAYEALERYTGRTFMQTTYQLLLTWRESFHDIYLPRPPHISVTSVEVADEDDTFSTVDSTNYAAVGTDPMRIPKRNNGWIEDATGNTIDNSEQALRITYVAGYGDTPDELPALIREAIKLYVRSLYDGDDTDKSRAWSLLKGLRYNRL